MKHRMCHPPSSCAQILNQNNADNASYITILTEPYVPFLSSSNNDPPIGTICPWEIG